jgi:NADH dehydrogenase
MRKRVVIVGGGFGGLNVAKALNKSNLDVLLIDKTNHHLFQPLLYQVATAALSPGQIAFPIRDVLRKQENTTVIMGDVVAIDKNLKEVTLGNGDKIAYDYLVIAVGARHAYFGRNEWEKFAPGLKTIADAIKIREQILISFEKAERMATVQEAERHLHFIVIGGGPTGVEMAGAIAEIAHLALLKNFRRIKPESAKIYLIEAAPRILPTYPEKLSFRAKKDLEKLGVHVMIGKKVVNITSSGVQVEDQWFESENVIWAAGNQASPLLASLDAPLDKQGRVIVDEHLNIANHPEIFVIGDASFSVDKAGKPLPGIAPTAIQQGKYTARIIKQAIPKEKRPPFRYFDKGYMATIGKAKAVAVTGKLQFAGFLAWAAWCFIHIVYLIGFRNRLVVMLEWLFFFITGERGIRLIYRSLEHEIPKH